MGVFDTIGAETHESVHFGHDPRSGLRAIVAIHSTALGPSLGGTRFYPYATEEDALVDVLRLSKGMTYKAACAGLDQGGGKAVIIGDPRSVGSDDLFRAYGRFVDGLAGRYITAEDVGTTVANMEIVKTMTNNVSGLPRESGGSGDPSPATARGVVAGMRAVAARLWNTDDLAGRRIAIKGIGKVGMSLAERLADAGADLVVADVNPLATDHAATALGAKVVSVDEIHSVDCDIFSPCALGADLNPSSIPELSCSAIAGSANNQLLTEEDALTLASRGILYAPDFVVNAGGIINIAAESGGYETAKAAAMVDKIYDNLNTIFMAADNLGIGTEQAAVQIADDRIAARTAEGAQA
ncbi:MAG: Glu/Leu/Phe/Val family dehydrogenase [Acidimicrobiia bacterium]